MLFILSLSAEAIIGIITAIGGVTVAIIGAIGKIIKDRKKKTCNSQRCQAAGKETKKKKKEAKKKD